MISFDLRLGARPRMKDFAAAFSEGNNHEISVNLSTDGRDLSSNIKSYLREKTKHKLINVRYSGCDDIVYSWGALSYPLNRSIVEFDNPFCVNFYNSRPSNFQRIITKALLKKVRALTFMSTACERHFFRIWGDDLKDIPHEVVYPIVPKSRHRTNLIKGKITKVLFVGPNGKMKGLDYFVKLADYFKNQKTVKFIAITERNNFTSSNVEFLPPCSREVLLNEILPTVDVFVTTSLIDSFNLTILEALSRSVPILAIENYATQDLILAGEAGVVISHPAIGQNFYSNYEEIIAATAKKFEQSVLPNLSYDDVTSEQLCGGLEEIMSNLSDFKLAASEHYHCNFASNTQIKKVKSLI